MKLPVLLVVLLLLALLLPPAGHSAHHRRGCVAGSRRHFPSSPQPLRVLRTPGAARQPKVVRTVQLP